MGRLSSRNKNTEVKRQKIKLQFETRMLEKTPSGASPSFMSVVKSLAEEWCISEHSIEAILRSDSK